MTRTGFRGYKFDFVGDDSGWYLIISALQDIHACCFTSTIITGISINITESDGVDHTTIIVISVTDPHSLDSACPCLTDSALSVEIALFLPPATLPSAVNLSGPCRSF